FRLTTSFSGPLAVVQRTVANELYISSKQSLFHYFEEVIAEEYQIVYAMDSKAEQIGTTVEISTPKKTSPVEMGVDEELNTIKITVDEELNAAEMTTDKILSSHGEEHLPLVSYARIFEKMEICMTAELDEGFDEVPPGMEIGSVSLPLIDKSVYQPSRSINSIPETSRYMTLALCRQRLHLECYGSSRFKGYTYCRKRKSQKTCQEISSKKPVEVSMDEQLSKPPCELVDHKVYVKNIQEANKASTSNGVSFVDKPSEKRIQTVAMANDAHDLNIQQDLKLVSSEMPKRTRSSRPTKKQVVANKTSMVNDSVMNTSMLTKPVKKRKCRNISSKSSQKLELMISCPESDGCARASINGLEWRNYWARNASPSERARVRGYRVRTILSASDNKVKVCKKSQVKVSSARTDRVKLRRLLRPYKGSELVKIIQMKARKKQLRCQRSKIHDWGLVALELIEAEDFVIEYVGEMICKRVSDIRESQYEKSGIGSSYHFRLDNDYVVGDTYHSSHPLNAALLYLVSSFFFFAYKNKKVDATKRGGLARFINHSCEVSVQENK
ncbi:Histone-lysine N-methyltransferase ATXR7, partial [Dichanthelium oligosanthes]